MNNTNDNSDVICTYNDIEIYKSDMDILCTEYESQYTDIEDKKKEPVFFTGLMIFISQRLFKPITSKKFNNDYNALNIIFYQFFLPVCVKYNRIPTLLNFCSMTGISNYTLSKILSGTYDDGSRVNPMTLQTVKKWKEECENALLDFTLYRNSVAGIFALKSAHSWTEATPVPTIADQTTQATAEQIQERYRDSKKPQLPEL